MKICIIGLLLLAFTAVAAASEQDIAAGKAVIAMKMKDPESVRFTDVVASEKGTVCGWINAKNSYGGYVGFKPFYVLAGMADIRDEDDRSSFTNRGWFAIAWRACGLVTASEKFGDSLLKLPKLKIEKECARKRKKSDKPSLYENCEANEAAAMSWLQGHPTGSYIALMCERHVREYSSYSSGQTCVEDREANKIIDRGPRSATQP